jgi:AAHS family 4-hydroxybenzoate transporter-like MFS transporter
VAPGSTPKSEACRERRRHDLSALPATRSPTVGAAGVVALCFAVNMIDGMDVTILSYVAPALQQSWSIDADTMGAVFSAGLLGMALGGVLVAPLADRLGRRPLILTALMLMSGGMLASGFVASVGELVAARIAVGVGIGTVLAAMAALAAEVAPPRQQNLAVGLVQAGYPLAAVFTGLAVARLLPSTGWQPLLLYPGILTFVMLPLAALVLPESRVLAAGIRRPLPIAALFADELLSRTLLLFTAIFMGLMVLYIIVSWITNLAIAAGLSTQNGIYAGALYNLGAFLGTVAMSLLAVRVALTRLVPALFVAAIVALLVFGAIAMPVGATLAVAFVIGVTLQGGYNGVCDGIVNATPLGMAKSPGTALPTRLVEPRHWVADIVYFPLETELLRAAAAKGCRVLDGSAMAVGQAAAAFEIFTARRADRVRMLEIFHAFPAPRG